MAQRMFSESAQDGRSVLGMLAVQVERDPKTGATVVRSVAPVATAAGAPVANAVFDDGRKSIHAVGGSGGQPSTEELGQILNAIDGVGMKVLLDEVTVKPNKEETKTENVKADRSPEGDVLSLPASQAVSKVNYTQLDSPRRHDLKAELEVEDGALRVREETEKEDGKLMVVRDMAVKEVKMENQNLEESPVTMVFLGYTDAATSQSVCLGQENQGHMLTVERVMITDDGEEHVLGPESTLDIVAGKRAEEEAVQTEPKSEVFQDVPLDGNGAAAKVQGDNGDKEPHHSSSPSIVEGKGTSKHKTCQCCSVM